MRHSLQYYIAPLSFILMLILAFGVYKLYRELDRVQTALDFIKTEAVKDLPVASVKEEIKDLGVAPTGAKKQLWSALQSALKDGVVQVFSQLNEFNWLEPYKTPTQQETTGTAFFINKNGDLITNAHVVDQAIHVAIQVPSIGKRRFGVDILGVSPERDLALLRVKPDEFKKLKELLKVDEIPYLTLGDSDAVKRGDKNMAIGFPLGQQGLKSTTGVVSGREHLPMVGHFIQISTPLNPGNSGGPSLDRRGKVIGVNSRGIPSAQNVGYIIPVNEVLLFLEQLSTMPESTKPKLIRKPFLGVFFNNANENLTAFLKNPQPGGLYVVDVYKGSPFDKAGIKAGDMIYKIDNYPVDIYGEMSVPWSKEDRILITDYVARLKLGHVIKLEFYRKGERKTTQFKLTLSESPIRRMYPGYEKIDYEVIGGFVIMPITLNHVLLLAQYVQELVQYADVKKQIEPSLLITHVLLNSPASRARTVGAGGLIAEVNGQRVKTLDDFRAAIPLSSETGYLTIKTTDNQFAALPVKELLEDEQRLASTYFYPVSEAYKELSRKAGKKYESRQEKTI